MSFQVSFPPKHTVCIHVNTPYTAAACLLPGAFPSRVAYLVPDVLPTSAVFLFPGAPLLKSFPLFRCSYLSSMPLSRFPPFYSSSVSISRCPLFAACLFPGAPPSSVASSRCLPSSSMPLFKCLPFPYSIDGRG